MHDAMKKLVFAFGILVFMLLCLATILLFFAWLPGALEGMP